MGSSLRDLIAFTLYEGENGVGNVQSDINKWETQFVNSKHCCRVGYTPDFCPRCEVDYYYKLADSILVSWKG